MRLTVRRTYPAHSYPAPVTETNAGADTTPSNVQAMSIRTPRTTLRSASARAGSFGAADPRRKNATRPSMCPTTAPVVRPTNSILAETRALVVARSAPGITRPKNATPTNDNRDTTKQTVESRAICRSRTTRDGSGCSLPFFIRLPRVGRSSDCEP